MKNRKFNQTVSFKKFIKRMPIIKTAKIFEPTYFEFCVDKMEELLCLNPSFDTVLDAIDLIEDGVFIKKYKLLKRVFKYCFGLIKYFGWESEKDIYPIYFFYGKYLCDYVENPEKGFLFLRKTESYFRKRYEQTIGEDKVFYKEYLVEILIYLKEFHEKKWDDQEESQLYAKKLKNLGYIDDFQN